MISSLQASRRRGRCVVAALGAALAVVTIGGVGLAASPAVDMRGDWACVAVAGTSRFPQTVHVAAQDPATGRLSGTDVGADGQSFAMTGSITGSSATMNFVGGTYSSTAIGAVAGTDPTLTYIGTFSDSNKTRGTWSCQITASNAATAVPTGPASNAPTGTAVAVTGVPAGPVVDQPSGMPPTNPDTTLALEIAAVLALLAGLGAAAAGLIPGVPGLAGRGASPTGSGSGQGSTASEGAQVASENDPLSQVMQVIQSSAGAGKNAGLPAIDQQALTNQLADWSPYQVGGPWPAASAASSAQAGVQAASENDPLSQVMQVIQSSTAAGKGAGLPAIDQQSLSGQLSGWSPYQVGGPSPAASATPAQSSPQLGP